MKGKWQKFLYLHGDGTVYIQAWLIRDGAIAWGWTSKAFLESQAKEMGELYNKIKAEELPGRRFQEDWE